MLLKELLDMIPLPYEWIDNIRCKFSLENKTYGIYLDDLELKLADRSLSVANISFGTFKESFKNSNDLDTSLTNNQQPRKILSTVASALSNNKTLYQYDILVLASSDQVKNKRLMLYSLAVQEIKNSNEKLKDCEIIELISSNGSKLIVLSKIKLDELEQKEILDNLGISK